MQVEANSLMVHNNQGVAKLLPSLTAVSLSHFEFVESLTAVSRSQWSALAINHNPFVSYPFLSALEQSGSVGEGTMHHKTVGFNPHRFGDTFAPTLTRRDVILSTTTWHLCADFLRPPLCD